MQPLLDDVSNSNPTFNFIKHTGNRGLDDPSGNVGTGNPSGSTGMSTKTVSI